MQNDVCNIDACFFFFVLLLHTMLTLLNTNISYKTNIIIYNTYITYNTYVTTSITYNTIVTYTTIRNTTNTTDTLPTQLIKQILLYILL